MKILYITHARIPTEKAHGVNIMFTCESFYKRTAKLKLIVPKIKNNIKEDPYEYYNIHEKFPIIKLPSISSLGLEPIIGPLSFWIQFFSFYFSAFFYLLFANRKDTVIYTRDYLASFLSLLGYKVVYECHSISYKERIFFKFCKKFTKIVVISKGLRDIFLKHGFATKKIFLAPDAVKLDIFDKNLSKEQARQKLNLPVDEKIVCYIGKFRTMGMDKGIDDILRAIKDLDLLFVAVGGSSQDIEHYKAAAEKIGVKEKVIFVGHLKQRALADYQKAADILLMPFPNKKHYANFMSPIKMFEYMASQRPIIASDLPTIREVLNHDNAVICQPDNPQDLENKIKVLFEDKNLAKEISQQAYQDVQEYSWEQRTNKIYDFLP